MENRTFLCCTLIWKRPCSWNQEGSLVTVQVRSTGGCPSLTSAGLGGSSWVLPPQDAIISKILPIANPEKLNLSCAKLWTWVPGRSFLVESWKRKVFSDLTINSWDSDDFFFGQSYSSNLILRAKVTELSDWKEYVTFQNWGKGGGIVFRYYQFGSILLLGILKCSGYGDLPFAGGGGFQKKQIHRKELAGSWRKVVKKVVEKRPFHQSGVENQPDAILRTVASRSTA